MTSEELRDNVRVRYNFVPEDMPQRCDGCGKPLTVEHALQCKVGGLVHIRHEDTGDKLRHLGGCATCPSKVEREPKIHSALHRRGRA